MKLINLTSNTLVFFSKEDIYTGPPGTSVVRQDAKPILVLDPISADRSFRKLIISTLPTALEIDLNIVWAELDFSKLPNEAYDADYLIIEEIVYKALLAQKENLPKIFHKFTYPTNPVQYAGNKIGWTGLGKVGRVITSNIEVELNLEK